MMFLLRLIAVQAPVVSCFVWFSVILVRIFLLILYLLLFRCLCVCVRFCFFFTLLSCFLALFQWFFSLQLLPRISLSFPHFLQPVFLLPPIFCLPLSTSFSSCYSYAGWHVTSFLCSRYSALLYPLVLLVFFFPGITLYPNFIHCLLRWLPISLNYFYVGVFPPYGSELLLLPLSGCVHSREDFLLFISPI